MIRLLSFFERFCQGDVLYKRIEADRFFVDEKTIQRDFEDLRDYLQRFQSNERISGLSFDRPRHGYIFKRNDSYWLNSRDILLLLKLLLGSQFLAIEELDTLWRKLLTHCSKEERFTLEELLKYEKSFYSSNIKNRELTIQLWQLEEAAFRMQPIQLEYSERNSRPKLQLIIPLGFFFTSGYFYLAGKLLEKTLAEVFLSSGWI